MIGYSCSLSLLSLGLATLCGASNFTDCRGVKAVNPACRSHEVPYLRDFFYVGGRYIETEIGNVTVDQIYVEKLSPVAGVLHPHPLVFFHGGGTSGVSWLNTPDNRYVRFINESLYKSPVLLNPHFRKGWASYFVSKGYHVYIVDAYTGGRSAANDFSSYNMSSAYSSEIVQMAFTGPTTNHTQFPGSGIDNGDAAFDAFKKALIPWATSFVEQETAMRVSGCELLALIGKKTFLISHSLGSFYPVLLSNDCPEFVKGSVNLEAATTPFWRYNVGALGGVEQSPWGLTFSPLGYEPPVNDSSGRCTLESPTIGHKQRLKIVDLMLSC